MSAVKELQKSRKIGAYLETHGLDMTDRVFAAQKGTMKSLGTFYLHFLYSSLLIDSYYQGLHCIKILKMFLFKPFSCLAVCYLGVLYVMTKPN